MNVPSARAIVRDLSCRQAKNPVYYIHTSGGFAFAAETLSTGKYGECFDKIYDGVGSCRGVDLTSKIMHPIASFYVNREMLQLAAKTSYKKGFIPPPGIEYMTTDESERRLLGWEPNMPSFKDGLENALDTDARQLDLV
ncbi:hypothetical protein SPOG_05703 [Schizosaccharomyces cryophilus OY26]|uniref:Uncharacterized protein n=1 Tax=Schizosaccharomyces cryophilus (strain OY26 / ATCC MYA-4695 / CBS 11777 / NBRC 106824 / NRRL Y48691) TaxID=653667 RepID=S9W4G4_SCHCR|nr:uncharacterized protein SPOG_05703 [Schizosaccharomyces cryophilus OY26]EPY53409.1 hypothetical protein SPOG_05703 [Schizosaccharomyces cryophilus OY26]